MQITVFKRFANSNSMNKALYGRYIAKEALSVVLVGDFNPVILQPFWFSSKKLIGQDEAKGADIEVIHNELVRFSLNWISFDFTKKRLEFRTTQKPYYNPLKDLVESVIKIIDFKAEAIGINHIFDFSLRDADQYYKIGDVLSPLNIWKSEFNEPRLKEVGIIESCRKDGLEGMRRVTISPSSDKSIDFGICFNVNNHFNISKDKSEMLSILVEKWDDSIKDAISIATLVLEKI